MDSVTHIVVGAVVGEAIAGKALGKRAMFYGALAHSLPDIDIMSSLFVSPAENLLIHRGITHSISFVFVAMIVLGLFFHYWYRLGTMPLSKWILFWGVEICLHVLLDTCNAYGTGWLEPFSHQRFAFNTLFVADPLFTLCPLIAFLVLWRKQITDASRIAWARAGLFGCFIYLLWALAAKQVVDRKVNQMMIRDRIAVKDYMTTPTVLNTLLWYVLIKTEDGVHIGYRSVFDGDKQFDLTFFPYQKEQLPTHVSSARLLTFSQGYYHVSTVNNAVIFHDLRFGQTQGWADRHAPFVFGFNLNESNENMMALQRGRFSGWDEQAARTLWRRMWGMRETTM